MNNSINEIKLGISEFQKLTIFNSIKYLVSCLIMGHVGLAAMGYIMPKVATTYVNFPYINPEFFKVAMWFSGIGIGMVGVISLVTGGIIIASLLERRNEK